MYPLIRLAKTCIQAMRQPAAPLDHVSQIQFRCMPWDMDLFMEMNNGRVLTLYDLGRFDLSIRTGFSKILQQRKWGLVVAGSTVRYRRRIRVFDRVTMKTRMAAIDHRWVYIIQSMWVNGEPASSVLLRTGVTQRGRVVPIEELKAALKIDQWEEVDSRWVKAWIDSEEKRPWPPTA